MQSRSSGFWGVEVWIYRVRDHCYHMWSLTGQLPEGPERGARGGLRRLRNWFHRQAFSFEVDLPASIILISVRVTSEEVFLTPRSSCITHLFKSPLWFRSRYTRTVHIFLSKSLWLRDSGVPKCLPCAAPLKTLILSWVCVDCFLLIHVALFSYKYILSYGTFHLNYPTFFPSGWFVHSTNIWGPTVCSASFRYRG